MARDPDEIDASHRIKEREIGRHRDITVQQGEPYSNDRRQILKAGAALATLPIMVATSVASQAADKQTTGAIMTSAKSEEFTNGMADLMAHSTRTPVLRWPNEYGMEYEEIFFPAMDGVTIEGWFIPASSDKLLIFNHPMPCNLCIEFKRESLSNFAPGKGEVESSILSCSTSFFIKT